MSSRLLRKLQKDTNCLENDEQSIEGTENSNDILTSGGARKKELNINQFNLLTVEYSTNSDSEIKDDNEITEPVLKQNVTKKKKKKRNSKRKNNQHSTNDEMDEIERSISEVNQLFGENLYRPETSTSNKNSHENIKKTSTLYILHKHLDPNNELKRMFGSKVFNSEIKKKNRNNNKQRLKSNWLMNKKETWSNIKKSGLSMSLIQSNNGILYFKFEHSQSYRSVQNHFLDAIETLSLDNIINIIDYNPYNVDALSQLSDLCKLNEEIPMAVDCIERALFSLENAFHPLFNISSANCRLDYRNQENRSLFITVFKHSTFLANRGCTRTALEFSKFLFSLDPEGDPLAVILSIDFYALRSQEYQWLISFCREFDQKKNFSLLPNYVYSLALAQFHLEKNSKITDSNKADELLQDAILKFPGLLLPLIEKCLIVMDSRVLGHSFLSQINEKKQPPALNQLIKLYVTRCYHIWKDSSLIHWIEKNVHAVLDKVDQTTDGRIIKDYESKYKHFQGVLPINIARHLILMDIKDLTPIIQDSNDTFLSFDPLPPKDSINIYTRRQRVPNEIPNSSPLTTFFRSILPSFQINQQTRVEQRELLDAAIALPPPENNDGNNNNGVDLRQSVDSLINAMRDLLNNIRPDEERPDGENDDADIDEDET